MDPVASAHAAVRLAGWIERTRRPGGYGGPVAHWWRDCLLDCRSGRDWRYEGVIAGYLELHRRSGAERWLAGAVAAGNDLVAAQGTDGCFERSRFELNPGRGGTPHEAAAAGSLLRLGLHLRQRDPSTAQPFLAAASASLQLGHIERLWDPEAGAFRDDASQPSFVPNKSCTLIEALVLQSEASGDPSYVERYALPTAQMVLRLQIRRPGSRLDGAIAQNRIGRQVVAKYFPYYVARCIPGLLAAHAHAPDDRYAAAALAAGAFVARWRDPDGGFPQVVYDDERTCRFPKWLAAAGDVLRALSMLESLGLAFDPAPTEAWLRSAFLPTGGVMTARGFAAQATNRADGGPAELRDLLSVVGWADKAFRYLAGAADPAALGDATPAPDPHEADCVFLGRRLRYRADATAITVHEGGRLVYRLRHDADWADVWEPWLAVR
jgi:hypothetical protein